METGRMSRMLLVCIAVHATVTLAAQNSAAQSLADVARQEALRRASITKPGWIYNDFTLTPPREQLPTVGDSNDPAEPGAAAETPTPDPGGEPPVALHPAQPVTTRDKRTKDEWRVQAAALHERIGRLTDSANGLESRWKEFALFTEGRRETEARAAFQETRRVDAALGRISRDLASLDEAWARMEDDATRTGIPPVWIAPPGSP